MSLISADRTSNHDFSSSGRVVNDHSAEARGTSFKVWCDHGEGWKALLKIFLAIVTGPALLAATVVTGASMIATAISGAPKLSIIKSGLLVGGGTLAFILLTPIIAGVFTYVFNTIYRRSFSCRS